MPGPRRRPSLLALAACVALAAAVAGCQSETPTPAASGPVASAAATAGPTGSPSPTPDPTGGSGVAVVPVVGFRLPWDGTDAAEAAATLAGTSARYAAVEVVAADADAILAAAGLTRPSAPTRLVLARDAATLRADVAAHRDRLGLLRAADVDASVRALRWGGAALFGVDRARTLADWPFRIPGDPGAFDPSATWTLVAAGDINMDGATARLIGRSGVDAPFDGGTATITGRTCCSWAGHPLPVATRTGPAGTVRALLEGADLAIANLEGPTPDAWTYHPGGYRFSGNPAWIQGVADAGIDWVSLANNHVLDAGQAGLAQTIAALDRWGVQHGGAGTTLADARRVTYIDVGPVTVALLAYDTIRPAYQATASHGGSDGMSADRVRADVAAARAAGADVVIVFPHWGTEYTAVPNQVQRTLGPVAARAGADLVLGNHTHWAGALAVVGDTPIVESMGDFVFGITRMEQTEEGFMVEATFDGARLIQLRLRPYVILDGAQPNLLDPAGSGRVVLDQVFRASTALDW